jgi:tripartite-type tricarboxylate transporter receptor subunit TctC
MDPRPLIERLWGGSILIVERRLRVMLQVHYRAEGQTASAGGHDARTSLGEQILVTQHHAFPERTVRVIDPFGAGGGVDVIARAVAERLSAAWGQRVTVENHPGAGSTVAPALVADAPADGYTLLINTSAHAYRAALETQLSYQTLRDFVSVAALTSQPYVLVAGARSGITTVTELIGAAEARPGEVRFASAGKGTGTHIAVEKLNRDLHITALHTPPGATDAITDVIEGTAAGRTAYAMVPIPTATPHIQDGGLVALGVSTVRRSRLLPDVPPLAEAGVEGFDFPIWYGIWAPARTPHEIVSKLARDISNALATAELLDWLNRHDADPMRMTQTEFAAFVESECERATLLLSSD